MNQQLLTIEEVSGRLKKGRSATYALVLSGAIPSLKIGRSRRVTVTALDAFIERMEQESAAASPATPTNA